MNAPTTRTELAYALEHIDRVVAGLRLMDRPDLADYLASLHELTRAAAAEVPALLATRDQIADFFAGISDNLAKTSGSPDAPPGAVEGCKPFVKVADMIARSIRGGVHRIGASKGSPALDVLRLVRMVPGGAS